MVDTSISNSAKSAFVKLNTETRMQELQEAFFDKSISVLGKWPVHWMFDEVDKRGSNPDF